MAIHWLNTNAATQQAVADLSAEPCIAIDTEFVRENTYFPAPGLIQLRAQTGPIYLLDPLTVDCQHHLGPLLSNPRITKVLHAAGEDLQVLYQLTGITPTNIYDCQIAAAFANIGEGLGLHRLLALLLTIVLPKNETRSNWLARPLSRQQLHYAALDVAYLVRICLCLNDRLQGTEKMKWNIAETTWRSAKATAAPDPLQCFRRIKGHQRLDTAAQQRLQRLAQWREETAQELNIPKTRISQDGPLAELAKQTTATRNTLRRVSLHPQAIRKFGESLLEVHAQIGPAPERGQARPPCALPISRKLDSAKLAMLQTAVANKAAALKLPASLLAPRRQLEMLLSQFQAAQTNGGAIELPEGLCGWRKAVVGNTLLQLLQTDP